MADDNPVAKEVQDFDKRKLRKTTTEEKNIKPSQADIDAEKAESQQAK